MSFPSFLYPIIRQFFTLLLVLGFIFGLAWVLDWKLHKLLTSLKEVIKLEVTDPIGRLCLLGLVLFIAIFLVVFISDEAFKLASSSVTPEIVSHSINLNMLVVIAPIYFIINLIILALLKNIRPK